MLRRVAALLILAAIALVGVSANRKPVVTMVAGLWDMKREELNNQSKRSFEHQLSYLEQGLQTDTNLIIFGEERLEKFIKEKRKNPNTVFVHKTLQSFHKNWQTSKMIKTLQGLKSRANWNQINSLPYFSLEMYNPVVMSKFFLMVEAIEHDIFDSDYFIWIDADLLHIYSTEIAQEYVSRKYLENILQIYQGPWYFNYYEFNEPLIFVGYANGSSPYLSHPVTQRDIILGRLHGGRI